MTIGGIVRRRVAIAVLAGFVAVSTACGDDDGDAGEDASAGEPIKVMTWTATSTAGLQAPQVRSAAEARIAAINADGGIDGRPVELGFCDTQFDPNGEAACARQAADGGFVAVVGSDTVFPNTLPLLERAGIAYIGGKGATEAELNSPISFPLAAGLPGWFQGAVALALEAGVERPAIVSGNVGPAQFAAQLMRDALNTAGVPVVREVQAPIGLPDQSAAAIEAADGTDGVLIATSAGDVVKIVQSLRQSGFDGVIAVPSSSVTESLDALGDAGNGLLLTSQVTPVSVAGDETVEQFIREMDAEDPGASKDERSLTTWTAMKLFVELADRLDGDVTAKTVLTAMTELEDPIELGTTADYRVKGSTSPLEGLPQIFNPTIVFGEIQNGQIVRRGSEAFVNPFEMLAGR